MMMKMSVEVLLVHLHDGNLGNREELVLTDTYVVKVTEAQLQRPLNGRVFEAMGMGRAKNHKT